MFSRSVSDVLDEKHLEVFMQAVSNILATEVAKFTYAQIVDGLPTVDTWTKYQVRMETHPVFQLNHVHLCAGALEKTRNLMSHFDLEKLHFEEHLLRAFQNASLGSSQFNLRLIEITAVACHEIAAHLFQSGDSFHKRNLHENWLAKESLGDGQKRFGSALPLVAFQHRSYRFPEQYPNGVSDMVGYWAESNIFGGVVLFDRGESELEAVAPALDAHVERCLVCDDRTVVSVREIETIPSYGLKSLDAYGDTYEAILHGMA
ncbi:hypothetical protein B7463_g7714, partial [Scytalidium lignicola]